jgi:hypothetical protein
MKQNNQQGDFGMSVGDIKNQFLSGRRQHVCVNKYRLVDAALFGK